MISSKTWDLYPRAYAMDFDGLDGMVTDLILNGMIPKKHFIIVELRTCYAIMFKEDTYDYEDIFARIIKEHLKKDIRVLKKR